LKDLQRRGEESRVEGKGEGILCFSHGIVCLEFFLVASIKTRLNEVQHFFTLPHCLGVARVGANGGKSTKPPHDSEAKEKKLRAKNRAKIRQSELAGTDRDVVEDDTVAAIERREEESDERWEERKIQVLREQDEELQRRLVKASNKREYGGVEGEEEDGDKQVIHSVSSWNALLQSSVLKCSVMHHSISYCTPLYYILIFCSVPHLIEQLALFPLYCTTIHSVATVYCTAQTVLTLSAIVYFQCAITLVL
jgi:hypothetical protein